MANERYPLLRGNARSFPCTTAFLLDLLKGDAHAALAPDAVNFPGITYQAERF